MRKTLYYLVILSSILLLFPPTIGQYTPIEFVDNDTKRSYYLIIVTILSFLILTLLALRNNIKSNRKKINTIATTSIIVSLIYIPIVSFIIIFVGFGEWKNENILYRNKENKNVTINNQIYDVGTFGYGERRIAEIRPLFFNIQIAIKIDISKIDKAKWIYTNEQGDLKSP